MLSTRAQIKIKYILDQVFAAALLVVLSPWLLVIAVLIKLDSRGSVLFCQQRIGWQKRQFTVIKFRTMVKDADRLLNNDGTPRCSRVTRLGAILRRTSLDELPQLLNILLGQMSFVGPRPGPAERHQHFTPSQQRRCEMKPGITGLAQVSGRNTLPWSRRVELDIQYVDGYSLWLDIRILLSTLRVVLTGEGTVLDRNLQQADDISQPIIELQHRPSQHDLPFPRIEPAMVDHYRKEIGYEQVLGAINESLAESHDRELSDLDEEYSTIHVIGVPRSGTTLLTQLISSTLDVGYINNLIAAYWRVPCYGIRLSEKLLAGARPASFRSDFGRTASIQEPHEFGYFWTHLLGYPEMAEQAIDFEQSIDRERLRRVLLNMAHTFGKPIVFKSFMLAWHLKMMQQTMPKSIFLWIRRDRIDNALSIAKAREAQLGSVEKWISIKPREYAWLRNAPVPTQIAGQIFFTELAIARQVELIGGRNVLEIEYQQMCANPQGVIERLRDLLRRDGQEVRQIALAPEKFEISSPRSTDHPLYGPIKDAIEKFEQERSNVDDTLRRAG